MAYIDEYKNLLYIHDKRSDSFTDWTAVSKSVIDYTLAIDCIVVGSSLIVLFDSQTSPVRKYENIASLSKIIVTDLPPIPSFGKISGFALCVVR